MCSYDPGQNHGSGVSGRLGCIRNTRRKRYAILTRCDTHDHQIDHEECWWLGSDHDVQRRQIQNALARPRNNPGLETTPPSPSSTTFMAGKQVCARFHTLSPELNSLCSWANLNRFVRLIPNTHGSSHLAVGYGGYLDEGPNDSDGRVPRART
jgi:hypothetical protein